jgi:branched-chain amino acid transport system substrate-binding protein
MHLAFFVPWAPEASPSPDLTRGFIEEWKKRSLPLPGLSQGFRGYDGIRAIAAAITAAEKPTAEAIAAAFWKVNVEGLNGKIAFQKTGPAGKESGQSTPAVYLVQIEDGRITVPQL